MTWQKLATINLCYYLSNYFTRFDDTSNLFQTICSYFFLRASDARLIVRNISFVQYRPCQFCCCQSPHAQGIWNPWNNKFIDNMFKPFTCFFNSQLFTPSVFSSNSVWKGAIFTLDGSFFCSNGYMKPCIHQVHFTLFRLRAKLQNSSLTLKYPESSRPKPSVRKSRLKKNSITFLPENIPMSWFDHSIYGRLFRDVSVPGEKRGLGKLHFLSNIHGCVQDFSLLKAGIGIRISPTHLRSNRSHYFDS